MVGVTVGALKAADTQWGEARRIADDANVGFCGTMGIVATLSF